MKIKNEKHNNFLDLMAIGTVEDVITGQIRDDLKKKVFDATNYQHGFELASPHGINSLGEAVLTNGKCYATDTDTSSKTYLKTIADTKFYTSGMFIIPKDIKHSAEFELNNKLNYEDFTNTLFKETQSALSFCALAYFETLSAGYITKAPVYGENIFINHKTYYKKPKLILHNVNAYIIGAITDFKNKDLDDANSTMRVVLYNNPDNKTTNITSHTHGITLTQDVDSFTEITPDIVDKTLHIYQEGTVIKSAHGIIFKIKEIKKS